MPVSSGWHRVEAGESLVYNRTQDMKNLPLKGNPSPALLIVLLLEHWRAEGWASPGSAGAARATVALRNRSARRVPLELCLRCLQDIIKIMNLL